jgi:hypothetical protein
VQSLSERDVVHGADHVPWPSKVMIAPDAARLELLDKLAEISRNIEEHNTAIFILEHERLRLQLKLRAYRDKTGMDPE